MKIHIYIYIFLTPPGADVPPAIAVELKRMMQPNGRRSALAWIKWVYIYESKAALVGLSGWERIVS